MLSEVEFAQLSAEVDEQLGALGTSDARLSPDALSRGGAAEAAGGATLPDAPSQRRLIESVTGEPFETFWHKYRRHLRRDLCVPGGMLHEQWRRYRDVESKAAVRVSYAWLAAMGIPTASLGPLAVAATVFLLNVMIKVGIDAICEGPLPADEGAAASPG